MRVTDLKGTLVETRDDKKQLPIGIARVLR